MLEFAVIGLAGLGIILMFIGRHLMIRDTGGDLPLGWIVVLRIVPFSELIYMVRHYSEAKTGGIVSIVGMWLIVPFLGQRIWHEENIIKREMEQLKKTMQTQVQGGELSPAALAEMPEEVTVDYIKEQRERLEKKAKKMEQLNARLTSWYGELQTKRAALANEPAQLEEFNAEAAAYRAFNVVAKEEQTEFLSLQQLVASKR